MTRTMLATLIALAALVPASAQAQYYKGKTITMIVNYPPGGPTDIEGRIVAQHLPDHIPGHPTIVVKNIGGGSGLLGSNELGDATPDGLTIGFFTLDVMAELTDNPSVRTHFSDFVLLAGVESPLVVYMRKDTPPGINVPADLMKAKDFKALSLNAQNINSINMEMSLDLLGIQYQASARLSRPQGGRNRDPAKHRADGQHVAVGLARLGRAFDAGHRHPALAIGAARRGRQLSAQPLAAQHADLRGVLCQRHRRQAARRAISAIRPCAPRPTRS